MKPIYLVWLLVIIGIVLAITVPLVLCTNNSSNQPYFFQFQVPPTSRTSGTPFSPTLQVKVVDSNGVTITSSTVAITMTIGPNFEQNGVLTGTTIASAVNGVASFTGLTLTLSPPGAGTFNLRAFTTSVQVDSNTFTIS